MKTDNRLENLELWASNHPSGQRVADLLEWAWALIGEYGSYSDPGARTPLTADTEVMTAISGGRD